MKRVSSVNYVHSLHQMGLEPMSSYEQQILSLPP